MEPIKALSNLASICRFEAGVPRRRLSTTRRSLFRNTFPAAAAPAMGNLLNNLALYYSEEHNYAAAETAARQALEAASKISGPDSAPAAVVMTTLANLDLQQHKYPEAKSLYQQALKIHQKSLGPSHPQIAIDLNDLGLLMRRLGKDKTAGSLPAGPGD